jgi:ADP-ribose pyrophosphatase
LAEPDPFVPPADGLSETTVSSELVFSGNFLRIKRDVARLPDGSTSTREFVVHPGAAAMIPIGDDERILVERQYRYSMGRIYVELPAGKIDAGESSLVTAKRELLEETGHTAARWAFMTQLHPAIGFSDELMDLYIARDLTHCGQRLDAEEFLQLEWVSLGWMMDEVRAGRLPDVKTQIATFYLERYFSGQWPWPAFDL